MGPTNWPPESLIRADIAEQKSYVCVHDGEIVGTFFYDFGTDIEPNYRVIEDGSWIGSDTCGVLHRLAAAGTAKGVGSACIEWAYAQCRHLRVDTHTDNVVMQNLLKKHGFIHCGTIYVPEDSYPGWLTKNFSPYTAVSLTATPHLLPEFPEGITRHPAARETAFFYPRRDRLISCHFSPPQLESDIP